MSAVAVYPLVAIGLLGAIVARRHPPLRLALAAVPLAGAALATTTWLRVGLVVLAAAYGAVTVVEHRRARP